MAAASGRLSKAFQACSLNRASAKPPACRKELRFSPLKASALRTEAGWAQASFNMSCRRVCLAFLVPVVLSLFFGYQEAPEHLAWP